MFFNTPPKAPRNQNPGIILPPRNAANVQLLALQSKTLHRAYALTSRKRVLQAEYELFIETDARLSASLIRKEWLREAMPDVAAMRLMANHWDDAGGPLASNGFVGFFRTDRDTLGFVFEDPRGMRAMWTVDVRTHSPRRLAATL